jgi:hypothetical protein
MIHYFSFPTDIFFGPGSRKQLAQTLFEAQGTRPLLVTDRDLAKLSLTQELVQDLENSPTPLEVRVFSEIWGNPTKAQVELGVKSFKAHKADAVIALGGGAAMDVAKAVALMVHHEGDLFDYVDGMENIRPIDQAIPFMVALPTTAGTGSEVGRSAVISDDQTQLKKIIFSAKLLPKKVLADPELTLSLPPKITAQTGMDALTHLVEAYLAKGYHPLCDGIALEGLKLVSKSLRECVLNGKDLDSRADMLLASMMGAIAFQKGLGVTHSCAHALSAVCSLHHGLANAILIPFCMDFNADQEPEKFSTMAKIWGTKQSAAKGFVPLLKDLKKDLGIPQFLAEVGVDRKDIERLVDIAFSDPCHLLNPKSVSKKDLAKIFAEALG